MKKLLPVLALVLAAGTTVQAGERYLYDPLGPQPTPVAPRYQPTPQPTPMPAPGSPYYLPTPEYVPGPGPGYIPGPGAPFASGPLFDCVEYEDLEDIHPRAVEKIVPIRLRAHKKHCLFGGHHRCSCECCEPPVVFVKICVPPCECERVHVSRDGTKVTYDYGKYKVELKAKEDKVEVEYED